jgi:acetyl-CoA acetyltransferase
MTEAFLNDAVRTRFGKQGGAVAWSDPKTWPTTLARRWAGAPRAPILSASTRSFGHANGAGKAVFHLVDWGRSVTACNGWPLTAGAPAAAFASAHTRDILGLTPLAWVAAGAASALEPQYFGLAPVDATHIALRPAGIGWSDVCAIELNKAFAAQSLTCVEAWKVDREIVNLHGGAFAISDPRGLSDARILGTLARSLQQSRQRWRVAVICIGVRQGLAVAPENVAD